MYRLNIPIHSDLSHIEWLFVDYEEGSGVETWIIKGKPSLWLGSRKEKPYVFAIKSERVVAPKEIFMEFESKENAMLFKLTWL